MSRTTRTTRTANLRNARTLIPLIAALAGSPAALAQFASGTGGVTYTVPPPKVISETSLSFNSGGAKIDLAQELYSASYPLSPFTFINIPEAQTILTATTDTARVRVEDRFSTVYTASHTFASPFPRDDSGFASLWFDAGDVGDLTDPGKPPKPATADQNRARAFMVADLIGLAQDSLASYGSGGGVAGSGMPKQGVVYAHPYKIDGKDQTSHFRWADRKLYILEGDGADVDVLTHEFGHGVADHFNFANRVGGSHGFGQTAKVPSGADKGKPYPELAWSEGIATYVGLTLQQTSAAAGSYARLNGFGDSWHFDREDTHMSVDIERGRDRAADGSFRTLKSIGLNDELSVARFVWDLYDGKGETLDDNLIGKGKTDNVELGVEKVWKVLTKPADGRAASTMSNFMDSLRKELLDTMPAGKARTDLFTNIGDLAADHALTPLAMPPAKALKDGPGDSAMQFRWATPDEISVVDDYKTESIEEQFTELSSLEENFKWFQVGLLDPESGELVGTSPWLSASESALPGSDHLFGFSIGQAEVDALLAGSAYRWLDVVVATGTSLYPSVSSLPTDFFQASMWGESQMVAIPTPGASLLIITGLSLITSRRQRS